MLEGYAEEEKRAVEGLPGHKVQWEHSIEHPPKRQGFDPASVFYPPPAPAAPAARGSSLWPFSAPLVGGGGGGGEGGETAAVSLGFGVGIGGLVGGAVFLAGRCAKPAASQ